MSFLVKERNSIDIDLIASFLGKEELVYDELIKKLNSKEFENAVLDAFLVSESIGLSLAFIRNLKHFIHKWTGGHCYIASFSKKCTDPVMWSHYAHNHTGFCLLFSIENNLFKKKESIHHSLDDEYKFEEVVYDKQNVTTNGFYTMPSSIYGNSIIDPAAERLKYWKIKRQSFLTKFESWGYEKEVRLIHDDWFTSNASANGVNKRPICERIFYYDQKQLTGIIFGSKMKSDHRQEIEIIILKMRVNLINDCVPLFIFYETVENTAEYEMRIKPLKGLDHLNKHFIMSEYESKKQEYDRMKEHFNRTPKLVEE